MYWSKLYPWPISDKLVHPRTGQSEVSRLPCDYLKISAAKSGPLWQHACQKFGSPKDGLSPYKFSVSEVSFHSATRPVSHTCGPLFHEHRREALPSAGGIILITRTRKIPTIYACTYFHGQKSRLAQKI